MAGVGHEGEIEKASQTALAAIKRGDHKQEGASVRDYLGRFSAAWVYTSMARIYVSLLEEKKRYAEANDLLRSLLGDGSESHYHSKDSIRISIGEIRMSQIGIAATHSNPSIIRSTTAINVQLTVMHLGHKAFASRG